MPENTDLKKSLIDFMSMEEGDPVEENPITEGGTISTRILGEERAVAAEESGIGRALKDFMGGPGPSAVRAQGVADPNGRAPGIAQALKDFMGAPPEASLEIGELAAMSDNEAIAKGREPTGVISGVIDVLSRGQYLTATVVNDIAASEVGIKSLGSALLHGLKEVVAPHDRTSFTDVLATVNPEWTKENPIMATVMGTAADIAFDPTTWLTLGVGGAGKAVKVTAKAGETLYLTQKGARAMRKLTQVSQRYIADELLTSTARFDWAEKHIGRMAAADPELVFKKGFQIHINVPFTQKKVGTLLAPEQWEKFSDATGLTALKSAVKTYTNNSTIIQSLDGTFNRMKGLPPQYVKLFNKFAADAESAAEDVIYATAKMAKGIGKDGAMKIGRAAHGISDDLMRMGEEGTDLTEDVIEQVQRSWFSKEGLGEKEINIYSAMRRGLNEMRVAENQVGLAIKEVAEYFPRYYDNIVKGRDATGEFYKRKRFTDRLKAAKSRVFDSVADAEEKGLVPEYNAVRAFSMRAIASRKAIAKKAFDDSVESLLKTEKFDSKTAALIRRDAREIGDSTHPNFDKDWMNALVNANDFIVNSVFRPAATILKPGFATFQALSNTVQMMWAGGATMGLKAAAGVAGNVVENVGSGFGGKYWEAMRKTLWNVDPLNPKLDSALILKHLDDPGKLANSRITSDIGISYTGDEVAMMVRDMRIAQGTSVLGVPGFKKTAMGELRRQNVIAAVADKTGASEGFLDFMSSAASYWNWPRMVEDMARTNFFTTALRQGHSPHEAMRLVNKALYDYTGGLTKAERMWVKRIAPFYSFTRFTLPLAADVITTKPGRMANTARGMKAFFATWNKMQGGEQLNETERHAVPGWILEQPSTFAKFGIDKRAVFNAFTNWTPLDAVNFLEPGDEKSSGIQRTVQKSFLSMLTPTLKAPLEHIMNTNFFTGRVIEDIYRTKDRLGTKGTLWQAVDMVIPDAAKELMGWEEGTDIRTGKTNIYINPWLAHYMTSTVPILNNIIRVMDGDLTVREKAMWTFGNISTYKIDMQEQYARLQRSRKAAVNEKKRQIKFLRSQGLEASAEEYQYELRQLMLDIKADRKEETERPRGPRDLMR